MGRYSNIKVLKDNENTVRYYRASKYPDIPYSNDDIYIESVYGDRLDIISYDYYKSTEYYWVILVANNLPGDSIFVPPGTQLRIPTDLDQILSDYDSLNSGS
jgi:hypothetical protein